MSDVDGERDEFDSVLRGLAAEGETSPSLTGAQIRRRGAGRRRRRRVAASAAVTVALVATAAVAAPRVLQSHRPPASPAASAPAAPSPDPSPSRTGRATVSLDLSRQRVVVERDGHQVRTIPVSVRSSSPAERLTVVSKSAERTVAAPTLGSGEQYDYRAQWVVELKSDGGATVLLLEWPFKSPRGSQIGVPLSENAQWLYQQLEIGATITVDHR
ncbi:L,D-transpeptidase [Streptomyces sp. SID13666]|uniref:L,D-transpeptidase n=1 Tax=unclassified Streptomyces TaxID=2593676 RepID=UPI0013BEF3AD|nr:MULTISPECIES: L,D-transpeptidase [unclassified Streptomyces]NEA53119.1 L,D-transpeptidase [Streptomyces sp. SID13666]NEA69554.1 L,D-transpeptidase [Streptomyces sp. SID13588]